MHLFRAEKKQEIFSSRATEKNGLNKFLFLVHPFPQIPTSCCLHLHFHGEVKSITKPTLLPAKPVQTLKDFFFCGFWTLFFFFKLDGCTESFLPSFSLGKHLSLTFVRVAGSRQDEAAVDTGRCECKRIIHSPQSYSWARKCANAPLNPGATPEEKNKKPKPKRCCFFDYSLSQTINSLHLSSLF